MTVAAAIQQGQQRLTEARIPVPKLTADVLLCHGLSRERVYLYAHPEQELSRAELASYEEFLDRRLRGEPTQYITGEQEFYGRPFRVTPAVMIPRPETEFVVEAVTELSGGLTGRLASDATRLVDVGCGSGAIAITLQLETGAEVVATDVSQAALEVAASNARRLDAAVRFVACDLLSAVVDDSVDVVASNPPYVPLTDRPALQREVRDYEPELALYGGPDGLDIYRRLVKESPRVLRPGGWLVVEFGIRQRAPLEAMLDSRWSEQRVVNDLAGLPRVLAARYCP